MGCIVGAGIMRHIEKLERRVEVLKDSQTIEEILLKIFLLEQEINALKHEAFSEFS